MDHRNLAPTRTALSGPLNHFMGLAVNVDALYMWIVRDSLMVLPAGSTTGWLRTFLSHDHREDMSPTTALPALSAVQRPSYFALKKSRRVEG
jgi:hypothetical protein